MTTQIKAGVIAANAVNSSELASGALSGQNFTGDVTFDTTTLHVDSTNNRVGIGTSSPDADLEVRTTQSMAFTSDTVNSITLGISGTNKSCIKFDTADTTHTNRVWAIENGAGDRLNFFRNGLDVLKLNQDGSVEIPGSITNGLAGAVVATFEGDYSANGDVKLASFERNGGAVAAAVTYTDATTDMEFGTTTSHNLSFTTGDTRRMTIDTSGNVGIGTTSPAQTLHVSSSGATSNGIRISNSEGSFEARVDNGEFYLYDVDDTRIPFLIDTSGNVGIGTTSPSSLNGFNKFIEIEGTSASLVLADNDATTWEIGSAGGNLKFFEGTDTFMTINTSGNVGIGTASPSYKLDLNGAMRINSSRSTFVDASEDSSAAAHIFVSNDGVGDFSQEAGHLVIQARTHTSVYRDIIFAGGINNASDLMRITGEGDVGIGTSSPNVKLVVNESSGDTAIAIDNARSNVGDFARLNFRHNGITGSQIKSQSLEDFSVSANRTSNLEFHVRNNGTQIQAATIDSSGNVGIGTSSPSSYNSALNNLVVADSGDSGITIASGTSSEGSIAFADGTLGADAYRGWINYNHGSNFMRFFINASERMRIDSGGKFYVGDFTNRENGIAQIYGSKNLVAGIPQGLLQVGDTNAQAAGVGGGINFIGKYLDNGTYTSFASVEAEKSNGTSGNYGGNLVFKTRQHGGDQEERMRINSNGTLMVGTTTNATYVHKAHFSGNANIDGVVRIEDVDGTVALSNAILGLAYPNDSDATNGYFIYMTDGNGAIGSIQAASGTSVSFNTTSDERLKKNIVNASPQLDIIKSVKVREFDWKRNDHHELGLIAQEIKDIIPNVVSEGGDDETKNPYGVDYGKLTPYLIKAIQEQQTIIDDLKSRIETLEG